VRRVFSRRRDAFSFVFFACTRAATVPLRGVSHAARVFHRARARERRVDAEQSDDETRIGGRQAEQKTAWLSTEFSGSSFCSFCLPPLHALDLVFFFVRSFVRSFAFSFAFVYFFQTPVERARKAEPFHVYMAKQYARGSSV